MAFENDTLTYVRLDEVDPSDVQKLLNQKRIREHLVEHELFDANSVKTWIKEKLEVDATNGCRVRGVMSNSSFAGWCGIQLENGNYEIAMVLDSKHWGLGKRVFYDVMRWAKELGHEEVFIHLLHTRPEYKFLKNISKSVFQSELLGRKFTTYRLSLQ